MKFSAVAFIAAALVGLSSASPTFDKPFGLIPIHSNTPVQNSGLSVADDFTIEVNQNNTNFLTGKFNQDGSVSVGDKFLTVQDDGALRLVADRDTKFSENKDEHVMYGGSADFLARKAGEVYKLGTPKSSASSQYDVPVALLISYQSDPSLQ